jgi:hypothetical protein
MNFGYLLIVSDDNKNDYYKMAYALAVSIKNTQREGYNKVAIVVDNKSKLEKFKSLWVFDHIIEWKEKNYWNGRSWMDVLSPFENTVCLDSDMLFLRDYSHWIEFFLESGSDLYICNKSYTYRGEIVKDEYYRKAFLKNDLPNFYSMWTFFTKSKRYKEFFELNRIIVENQKEFTNNFLTECKPKIIGTDESFALSAKILGISDEITYELDFPKIVHMKPMIQNWPWPADEWSDHVSFYLKSDGSVKIGNYNQDSIIHYVKKDLITDEYVHILEKILWKK